MAVVLREDLHQLLPSSGWLPHRAGLSHQLDPYLNRTTGQTSVRMTPSMAWILATPIFMR